MKHKPVKSEEFTTAQQNRKLLLLAMGRAVNARDKNKYITSQCHDLHTAPKKDDSKYVKNETYIAAAEAKKLQK